jgi:hypothetical protein
MLVGIGIVLIGYGINWYYLVLVLIVIVIDPGQRLAPRHPAAAAAAVSLRAGTAFPPAANVAEHAIVNGSRKAARLAERLEWRGHGPATLVPTRGEYRCGQQLALLARARDEMK